MKFSKKSFQNLEEFFDFYWSEEGEKRQSLDNFRSFAYHSLQYAYSRLGTLKGKLLLEIGPGRGEDAIFFAKGGAKVLAIDISERSLRLTKSLAEKEGVREKVMVLKMKGEKLGLKERKIDLIFARTTLMHLNRGLFLSEANRVLKNGGRIVFVEPLRFNPFVSLYRATFSLGRLSSPQYLSLKEIRARFKEFSHQEFYLFSLLFLIFSKTFKAAKLYELCLRIAQKVDEGILRLFPNLKNFSWITVMSYEKGDRLLFSKGSNNATNR